MHFHEFLYSLYLFLDDSELLLCMSIIVLCCNMMFWGFFPECLDNHTADLGLSSLAVQPGSYATGSSQRTFLYQHAVFL